MSRILHTTLACTQVCKLSLKYIVTAVGEVCRVPEFGGIELPEGDFESRLVVDRCQVFSCEVIINCTIGSISSSWTFSFTVRTYITIIIIMLSLYHIWYSFPFTCSLRLLVLMWLLTPTCVAM